MTINTILVAVSIFGGLIFAGVVYKATANETRIFRRITNAALWGAIAFTAFTVLCVWAFPQGVN